MQLERRIRRAQQVNLTPLIDVVFLLIVFFMLSTSFVISEAMELSLPSDNAGKALSRDVMVLRVQQDGKVIYGDQKWSVEEVEREVRQALRSNDEQKFLVLSTENVTVQQLVTVLDVLYISGASQVQINHSSYSDIGGDVRLEN